ncbi:MAG: peptide deformylase [Candidatus Niyogibacteria bacterium]|nr:peptide deformylase [Candidatus Niyogibacteria bacterium]
MIIVFKGEKNNILRAKAKEVPQKEIPSKEIQGIVKKMAEVLTATAIGVGLAAPQIGISKRIFIALKKEFLQTAGSEETVKERKKNPLEKIDVYINPEIIKRSKGKIIKHEGCLSIPEVYGIMERHEKATIRAFNEKGKQFERGASGILSQIFQHEVDHLNGILFIDTATIAPKEISEKIGTP